MDDLTALLELSEQSILNNLQERYVNGTIYTYCRTILVALNPYQVLGIYGSVMRDNDDFYVMRESLFRII